MGRPRALVHRRVVIRGPANCRARGGGVGRIRRGDIPRMAALAADALHDGLRADTPAPFMAHFVLAGSSAI